MKPPSGGPRMGPTTAGISTQLVAWIRSRFSTLRIRISRPTGIIRAPPMPCRKRAVTRKATLLARLHRIEPSMKVMMAARNTVRAPKRSAMRPDTGMKMARLIR